MKVVKKILAILIFPFLLNAQYTGGSGDGFAVWTSQNDIPLPVELLSYRSNVTENSIFLEWETASELENVGFIVKRKNTKENSFKILDSYQSNSELKGIGTSSFGQLYAFKDLDVIQGNDYIYRVTSVNYLGIESLVFQSGIIDFNKIENPVTFSIAANYPNPFNPKTKIVFENKVQANVKVSVYNVLGELVQIIADRSFDKGRYELEFRPGQTQSSQLFICRIESNGIIKNFKMTYAK